MNIRVLLILFITIINLKSTFAQTEVKDTTIHMATEQAPLFPCDTVIEDYNKRAIIAQKQMLTFVYKNVEYPKVARENGIQGKVFVSFVVEKDGAITNIKVMRGISDDCDAEVIRIVQSMPKWEAGLIQGKPVRTRFVLPVEFKLKLQSVEKEVRLPYEEAIIQNNCKGDYYQRKKCGEKALVQYINSNLKYEGDVPMYYEVVCLLDSLGSLNYVKLEIIQPSDLDSILFKLLKNAPNWIPALNEGENISSSYKFSITIDPSAEEKIKIAPIYLSTDQMPIFPNDCKGTYEEQKECGDLELLKFVYDNIIYPTEARENGTEGIVIVSFVVEKDGFTSNFELLREIGDGCGEAALQVFKLMNSLDKKWNPGIQRSQPVRVLYNIPVRFRLE